ncbi:MAG: RtcB family protein [Candidatus Eisenbacteria bacterium]|nr:RtcB family protein [Candidatus Eisenbacteria bacterium]
MSDTSHDIRQVRECVWELPRKGGMRVPGRVYADERLMPHIRHEKSLDQVANVAHLAGIVCCSLAMPDIHWGYGFPIGGVAAMDPRDGGVVSPGGVGYDINCGVRLIASRLDHDDIRDRVDDLTRALFRDVPSGVGSSGAIGKLSEKELRRVMEEGAEWAVSRGFGTEADLDHTEERGRLRAADPSAVGPRAVKRGLDQVGTLGAGNHFLEIGVVDEMYDETTAAAFGLRKGGVTIMIHSGSRGLGYQVCDDYLEVMQGAVKKYGIVLPDRQLSCAPVDSPEGRQYLSAMACAANYAWANRQVMMALAKRAFAKALGRTEEELGLRLVYDVCHNIAKLESHDVGGASRVLCVHRKGATRAFPPGHPDVPPDYRKVGQPVLVPGDMGTNSFVCVGTDLAMKETFGSTCHGAGRVMSRTQARKSAAGRKLADELGRMGISVMAAGKGTLAEEMPEAYKNVSDVVDVMDRAGIARRVARLRPLGVVKG